MMVNWHVTLYCRVLKPTKGNHTYHPKNVTRLVVTLPAADACDHGGLFNVSGGRTLILVLSSLNVGNVFRSELRFNL